MASSGRAHLLTLELTLELLKAKPWCPSSKHKTQQAPRLGGMTETTISSAPLPIPDGPFKAYLFDLDGTLADSMPLHLRSWQQATREMGGDFPIELFWAWGGIPLTRTVEMLNERFGWTLDPAATVHRKEQLYLTLLDGLKPIPSVLAHVEAQHGKLPMAIVSGSPRLTIERTLAMLGLSHFFATEVGMEDYTQGKPAPEPFLVAAARLGIAPKDCLVFEDAEAGFQSAQAAGMAFVRVPVRRE